MTTLTISLPDSLQKFVERQIAAKGYVDVSEYVGSLLRDAQAKEEDSRLEASLLEGLASDRLPLDSAFWDRLDAKTETILERHAEHRTP